MLNREGPASTGTSAASPAELQTAGRGFQTLSNAFGGMADTPDLQNGGQLEIDAIAIPGDADDDFAVPGSTKDALQAVTQGLLGVLLAGRVQFADAAIDLFQVAGDFKTADHQIPSDAVPTNAGGLPPGITSYVVPGGTVYLKDKDGTVVESQGSTEKILGQSYTAAKAS